MIRTYFAELKKTTLYSTQETRNLGESLKLFTTTIYVSLNDKTTKHNQ
jgi:hypothetical protein